MSRILLVAAREYRQVAATRGFWVMLLIVPLVIAGSIFATRFVRPPQTAAYVIEDATGVYAPLIARRMEINHQRAVLGDLSDYARRWKLAAIQPGALWASGRSWFNDDEVAVFIAAGGADPVVRQFAGRLPAGAPAFKPPPPAYIRIPTPAGAAGSQGAAQFGEKVAPYLQGDVMTPLGKRPLAAAIYIPADFGQTASPARIWTNGRMSTFLISVIEPELDRALRVKALEASGLQPEAAARIDATRAPLAVSEPRLGAGHERLLIRSAVPLALVYILLLTSVSTGSLMLQGVIEERSNKLLESVLACVRPDELMYGKLAGLGGVGLTIVAFWVACGLGAALSAQGAVAEFVRPALTSIDQPWMIAALVFYFLAGYLVVSAVFLAIGSLSNSTQDAQAYLTPVLMAILVPVVLLIESMALNPESGLVRVLSWIPIYTPFAMLARLGGGASATEVLGTGLLLVVFLWLELLAMGRIFRASVLNTGQPPKLMAVARLMLQRQEG
jgi:ABC-2 type transport system permease protein